MTCESSLVSVASCEIRQIFDGNEKYASKIGAECNESLFRQNRQWRFMVLCGNCL